MRPEALLPALRAINERAAFNRWAGFTVARAEPGAVELELSWREEFGQYSGFLHAGLIGALIDTVNGYAAFSKVGPVLASHFAVNCLAPAVGQRFIARGQVVKAGRKQIFTRGELYASASGESSLVAIGEAILVPMSAVSSGSD